MAKKETPSEEQKKMVDLRRQGFTFQQIGTLFGCSRQYVHQVWQRWSSSVQQPVTENQER